MRMRSQLFLVVVIFTFAASLPGQRGHKIDWKPGSAPGAFDKMDKDSPVPQPGTSTASADILRARDGKLAGLNVQLTDLIHAATDLQEQLKSADPNNTLSVELRSRAKQLEAAAHKIHKGISDL
jgi:hypothetical protein